jgi:hypothetical protein
MEYVYAADNHMLLEAFSLREKKEAGSGQGQGGGSLPAVPLLVGSEMHLHGKPRYFLPLHFTAKDVGSELIAYMQKPLGTSGQLSFFLDVLFFKIKLNLKSAVTLYKDAVHVPVVMTLPLSGASLREGSGMFYGFHAASREVVDAIQTTLPRLGAPGAPEVRTAGRPTFFLSRGDACVAVAIHDSQELRELGFQPHIAYPSDLKALGFPKVAADFGVFYDVRKLKKGRYRFDVWFYVARGESCGRLARDAAEGFEAEGSVVSLNAGRSE